MLNKNCMQNIRVVCNCSCCFIFFFFFAAFCEFNLLILLNVSVKILTINIFQVILTEIINDKFVRTFKDSDPVACLKDSAYLFAIEMPESKLTCSVEQEKITLIVNCNLQHDENDSEM